MSPPPQSPINQMFDGRSVLITGASGFIGRVLLEKLLRTYTGIKRIYILMRPKKNLSPQERLNKQLLAAPIFDKLKQQQADSNGRTVFNKIHLIEADISEVNLKLSSNDLNLLLSDQSLSFVFHAAATVKFHEPLKTSVQLNLIACKSMIDLCTKMNNLLAFCHVSSAFVNSDLVAQNNQHTLIEEKLYPIEVEPENMIKLTEILDVDCLQKIQTNLVGRKPNNYTFTKALGEKLVSDEANQLPVVIVRPSIVVAAWQEPCPGWVDNFNGATGLVLAIGKGLLRSMWGQRQVVLDIIPVDICVNTMIAASYYVAKKVNNDANIEATTTKRAIIFHCTSSDTNPITLGQIENLLLRGSKSTPSQQVFRRPVSRWLWFGTGLLKSNKHLDLLVRVFVHYLPALLIDLLCIIMGKKPHMLAIYRRLHEALEVLAHFCNNSFKFQSNNTSLLEECLQDDRDKRDLPLSVKQLNWNHYWRSYLLGARRFVLNETDDNKLLESRKSLPR